MDGEVSKDEIWEIFSEQGKDEDMKYKMDVRSCKLRKRKEKGEASNLYKSHKGVRASLHIIMKEIQALASWHES